MERDSLALRKRGNARLRRPGTIQYPGVTAPPTTSRVCISGRLFLHLCFSFASNDFCHSNFLPLEPNGSRHSLSEIGSSFGAHLKTSRDLVWAVCSLNFALACFARVFDGALDLC